MASAASCAAVALVGSALALSNHTPASGVTVGCLMWVPLVPQFEVPVGTPSQYWFMIVPQVSTVPNSPLKNFCMSGATPAGSLHHCLPQNTRYTGGLGETRHCAP